MFQDQSELILCSGSGFVTFVNSKQEVKRMPLSAQNDTNLEQTDKSLFKRLQYAKEILVQMMSVKSMPESLTLTNQAAVAKVTEGAEAPAEEQNFASQQTGVGAATAANAPSYGLTGPPQTSVEPLNSRTKSATKNCMIMSPYNSKTTQKAKDAARSHRMHTLTASKTPTSTTNLLNSNAKKATK